MPIRPILHALTAIAAFATLCSCGQNGRYVTITGYAQGGEYMVKLRLDGINERAEKHPELLKDGIDSILVAIDNSLSGYNPTSLLSRFNAGESIVPDTLFLEMYGVSRKFYDLTGGAFDVSSGPLFDLWGFGFKEGGVPTIEEVEAVEASCGMYRLRRDMREAVTEDGTLNPRDLLLPDQTDGELPVLNYNAIAQGYSCDLLADHLHRMGVTNMLVMLGGGEIYSEGLNPSGKPWIIGVDKPIDGNNIAGAKLEGRISMNEKRCGIATSGNYRKFYVVDGRKYAHTIDPRSGGPVSHNLLSATIIADNATTADALATYCMVIGLEQSIRFISAMEGVEGYLIYDAPTAESFSKPSEPDQKKPSEDESNLEIWISKGIQRSDKSGGSLKFTLNQ